MSEIGIGKENTVLLRNVKPWVRREYDKIKQAIFQEYGKKCE